MNIPSLLDFESEIFSHDSNFFDYSTQLNGCNYNYVIVEDREFRRACFVEESCFKNRYIQQRGA